MNKKKDSLCKSSLTFDNSKDKVTVKKGSEQSNARSVALSILNQVIYGSTDTQEALDRALQEHILSSLDKKLCTELVYGTIRQKIRLDWFLSSFLESPEKLPKEIILVLEIALYEFFFLRIPVHASFDMAVSLVKRKFGRKMSGLVNAVLRNAQRNAENFALDSFYEEKKNATSQEEDIFPIDVFSRKFSMPLWIGRLWETSYGKEQAIAYLKASSENAPVGIRINSEAQKQLTSSEGSLACPENYIFQVNSHAYAFESGLPQDVTLQIEKGYAVRQSVASYEVLYALQPEKWAMPIWDCCAGRGGKSMALIEAGYPVSLVSDISSRRLKGFLQDYKDPLHKDICVLSGSAIDISDFLEYQEKEAGVEMVKNIFDKARVKHLAGDIGDTFYPFGTVLVDAPCSGFGTLSRHPEIRLRRSKEDIKKLAQTQHKILRSAMKRVRVGGNLIYITCTLTPEENEEQVASLLQEYPFLQVERSFTTPYTTPLKEFFYGVCFKVLA